MTQLRDTFERVPPGAPLLSRERVVSRSDLTIGQTSPTMSDVLSFFLLVLDPPFPFPSRSVNRGIPSGAGAGPPATHSSRSSSPPRSRFVLESFGGGCCLAPPPFWEVDLFLNFPFLIPRYTAEHLFKFELTPGPINLSPLLRGAF